MSSFWPLARMSSLKAAYSSPAMGGKQYVRPDLEVDWERSLRWSARLLPFLLARPLAPRVF
jgi:hypothetical protein